MRKPTSGAFCIANNILLPFRCILVFPSGAFLLVAYKRSTVFGNSQDLQLGVQTRVQGPAADTEMRPLSLGNLITVSLIDKITLAREIGQIILSGLLSFSSRRDMRWFEFKICARMSNIDGSRAIDGERVWKKCKSCRMRNVGKS